MIQIGLENFVNQYNSTPPNWGRCAVLCHAASVDKDLTHSLTHLKKILGTNLVKIFGPQHGFVCDVQDNMIETDHFHHPYFDLPVFSLYGETRVPTDEMLTDIDTFIIDLQDVGTRVYTYITSMAYCMKQCEKRGIKVVIFDRPNPVGGELIEGNILEDRWKSFVGHHPIPMRHALTMGEVAKLDQKLNSPQVDLEVITMTDWKRQMSWDDCERIWVNPSPNLATVNSAAIFPGSVLFEGTNWSEGRGTTRALEIMGAPGIEPFSFAETLKKECLEFGISDVIIKPSYFYPMFQKHRDTPCGGVQLFCQNPNRFHAWKMGQLILKTAFHHSDFKFKWNDKPYEYENENLAIDYINGSTDLRSWVENNGSHEELHSLEQKNRSDYLSLKEDIHLY